MAAPKSSNRFENWSFNSDKHEKSKVVILTDKSTILQYRQVYRTLRDFLCCTELICFCAASRHFPFSDIISQIFSSYLSSFIFLMTSLIKSGRNKQVIQNLLQPQMCGLTLWKLRILPSFIFYVKSISDIPIHEKALAYV